MATKSQSGSNNETDEEVTTVERSAPIDVSPVVDTDGNVHDMGGNLLAAWQGVRHLFDGKFDSIEVVTSGPTPGVIVKGFTTGGAYDPQTIVDDISGRDRRVSLLDAYPILQGEEPPLFATSLDMTKWMQAFFRKPGDENGKSPQYTKDAIAAYKIAHEFPRRKGRPKKVVRIEALGSIDDSLLAGVDVKELEKLLAKTQAAIAAQNGGNKTAATAASA